MTRPHASLWRRCGAVVLAGIALVGSSPVLANSAAEYFRARAARSEVPTLLSQADRDYYTALFAAIRREDWIGVDGLLAQRYEGPLHNVALTRYYLAPTSPKFSAEPILAVLEQGRELPWADQLRRLAISRGATYVPDLPGAYSFVRLPPAPRRQRPRPVDDATMPADIAAAIQDRIKNDDPMAARQLLDGIDALLSPAARAEWRQRVAWSFYIENDDRAALALARTIREGSGPWVAEGYWTQGLAAWRLGACDEAARSFEYAAASATNAELGAAGSYWASRAWLRCRAPERVAANLRAAARNSETLYGMLAAEALGAEPPARPAPPDFSSADWQLLRSTPNIRAAIALGEIGEDDLAGEILRHQARIGDPRLYGPMTRLARDLGLASTQLWMAYNAPRGGAPDDASRYPTPRWMPANGWQVDPGLIYAHTLQESNFRTAAVSPANARGLMQIMPATASQHSRALALDPSAVDLNRPDVNLAIGQRHLEMLRDTPATQGLLPKVMAAYNAGLRPLMRWNHEVRDGGDPLLWMESLSFWETRGYVSIVMRNYWMYESQAGPHSDSRRALSQGLWPRFPGPHSAHGVRLASSED